jgi:chemotaxis protein methyltransferase CheR
MKTEDYDFVCQFLLKSSGLSLGADKQYLIESRLVPIAQSQGMADLNELIGALRQGRNPLLQSVVTEAMTTNETSFFRDRQPFEDLKTKLLPELIESRRTTQTLRIWCAASSTGQEPYSILMLLHDEFPQLRTWKIELVATDLATKALERAAQGIYSHFEVQRGLPIRQLMKHFKQIPEGWQVSEELRQKVSWQQLNLLGDFSRLGQFDLVFCRNVLIYFDVETKRGIVDRIHRLVRGPGFLILGAAESLLGLYDGFQRFTECRSAVYRLGKPAPAAPSTLAGQRGLAR